MKKICFFNHYHNGDIHLSRGFIKAIIEKFPQYEYVYTHRNGLEILKDLSVNYNQTLIEQLDDKLTFYQEKETVYLNTWYGSGNFKYLNRFGISFDVLYDLFDDFSRNILGITFEDIQPDVKKIFPIINYDKYQVNKVEEYLKLEDRRKVFLSNGELLSGQGTNFDFDPIIEKIADKYHGIVIICSNASSIKRDNVLFSRNIIQKEGNDLNENAFLSQFCHTIIGRASGSFSFSINYENLFSLPKKILCFSNLFYPKKFWLRNKFENSINFNSKIIQSNATSLDLVLQTIEKEILT